MQNSDADFPPLGALRLKFWLGARFFSGRSARFLTAAVALVTIPLNG
jgi:hypothetical protein